MRDTWTTGIELNAVYSRAWRPTNLFRSVIIAISRGLPLRITANGVCSHAEIAKPTADCRFGTPAWKSETAAPGEMLISRFVTRRFPFVIDQFLLDDIHTRPRASIVTSDLVFLIFLRFSSFLFLFFFLATSALNQRENFTNVFYPSPFISLNFVWLRVFLSFRCSTSLFFSHDLTRKCSSVYLSSLSVYLKKFFFSFPVSFIHSLAFHLFFFSRVNAKTSKRFMLSLFYFVNFVRLREGSYLCFHVPAIRCFLTDLLCCNLHGSSFSNPLFFYVSFFYCCFNFVTLVLLYFFHAFPGDEWNLLFRQNKYAWMGA